MSRVTGVQQAMLMWGARAACSGAVDCLCRCAPPADTAPLRASAPCLPYRSGSKYPPKKGRGPHAPAPLCSAPLAWSISCHFSACPMLCINSDFVCPTPSRKPRPFSGGLTARKICGCGRARRARLCGLRCQRCAQTRTTRRFAARATAVGVHRGSM